MARFSTAPCSRRLTDHFSFIFTYNHMIYYIKEREFEFRFRAKNVLFKISMFCASFFEFEDQNVLNKVKTTKFTPYTDKLIVEVTPNVPNYPQIWWHGKMCRTNSQFLVTTVTIASFAMERNINYNHVRVCILQALVGNSDSIS